MGGGKDEGFGLAESLTEPAKAVASGSTVGRVEGLIWSDASGMDVVSVVVRGSRIAVPIASDAWRGVDVVDLKVSLSKLHDAPLIQHLEATGGSGAVELVANHFALPLSGPPPGPSTGTLPPWWSDVGKVGDDEQGDGSAPVVGAVD